MTSSLVLIVGATGGIGQALAHRLHAASVPLLLAARHAEPLAALGAAVEAPTQVTDATDWNQLDALVDAAAAHAASRGTTLGGVV
ncbi:SDR family NAD(P)-dependent oxidoreductase, partial [Gemmatimonas sp.]|uniref:SDR family NAD(P)-dependent oxidoreductase n=1 Tax=Gemmatimonas sp. TaxID=1962908 RepID=UPI0037C053E2